MAIKRLLLILAGLLLAGCANLPAEEPVWPYPEPPQTEDWGYAPEPTPEPPPRGTVYMPPLDQDREQARPAHSSHPTVVALVDQAESERAKGELERAAGTLERAIRIANNDPLPWLKLAELRFEQGNLIQAENLARRSLSFAASGPTARDSWLLIADIKRLQGDAVAAEEARSQALKTQG